MPDNVLSKVHVEHALFILKWLRISELYGETKSGPRLAIGVDCIQNLFDGPRVLTI